MKTNKTLLLAVILVSLSCSAYAQVKAGEAVVKAGLKEGAPVVSKQTGAAVVANMSKRASMVAFPSLHQNFKFSTTATDPKELTSGISAAVKTAEQAQTWYQVSDPAELTPLERGVNPQLVDEISASVQDRLEKFIVENNAYPRSHFFKDGKELKLGDLTSAQESEKTLFENVEKAIELMPHNAHVQTMKLFKEQFKVNLSEKAAPAVQRPPEKIMTPTEKTFNELKDFILKNDNRFPKNHFGEDMSGLSAEEELSVAQESVLREKIDRVIEQNPNDIWVQEMNKLKVYFEE